MKCTHTLQKQEKNGTEIFDRYERHFNKNIIDRCIALRKLKRIALPDAIIAATAITHKLIIISRNTKDFADIEGLVVIDPYSL